MQQSTKGALNRFSQLDSWTSGHPADEERFLNFIIQAYQNGDYDISLEDFIKSFPELNEHQTEKARELFIDYQSGISLLRQFNNG